MNNRYLYRAKRTDNGEWVEGLLVKGKWYLDKREICAIFPLDLWFYPHCEISEYIEVDQSTICQCTGLKDKNGNLIFENDILDGHIKRGYAFSQCKVLWNECKARFDVRAMDCNFPMTLDECTDDISISGFDYEVIGNIFDNPELIEAGKEAGGHGNKDILMPAT